MRILFLSRWFPYPPDNGSRIRIYNLLKQLAEVHEVALITFVDDLDPERKYEPLEQICVEVHAVRYKHFQPTRLTAVAGFFSSRPRSVVDTYSAQMEQKVRAVAKSFEPSFVIASEIDMVPYALLVRDAKRLLDELQLAVLQDAASHSKQRLMRLRRSFTWWKHSRYVAQTLRYFDACTVVSEQEYGRVQQVAPTLPRLKIVPNGVNLAEMEGDYGQPLPGSLIYTGALTFHANLDAMHYFVQEIFPLILAQNPQVRLKITGSTKGVPDSELPLHPNVTLTGYLAELRPAVARSYLTVVPLRIGGGTRLKILESLALGTPVVTTSKGLEGLKIAPGEGVLVANTPEIFADTVLKVLREPELRQQLSDAGRKAVQPYDWRYSGNALLSLIDDVMARTNLTQVYPT